MTRIAWIKIQTAEDRGARSRKFHCPNQRYDQKTNDRPPAIGYSVGIRSGSYVAGLPGA